MDSLSDTVQGVKEVDAMKAGEKASNVCSDVRRLDGYYAVLTLMYEAWTMAGCKPHVDGSCWNRWDGRGAKLKRSWVTSQLL